MSFTKTVSSTNTNMWNDSSNFGGGYQSMDSFGGGGFGGGGYMQDGGGFGSPMTDSQEKKRFSAKAQSILPCTIKQLHSATYNQTDDSFKLGDNELNQVTIVGVIRDAQESATNIMYTINDMTGDDLLVRKWIDNEESDTERDRRSACRENTYVRIVGHLKSFKENSRSLIAFYLTPVTDFNEITYHMLDVIHSHLALSKLPEMSGVTTPMRNATPGGHGFQGQMTTPGRMGQGFGGDTGGPNIGLTGLSNQIQTMIKRCQSEQGMGFTEIKQKLRGVSDTQIRSTLEWLSNEGHIYSTIDDDHYKSTD
ncbi:DNA-directed RNA polymerase I subunit rpa2 [Porites harrisoni]